MKDLDKRYGTAYWISGRTYSSVSPESEANLIYPCPFVEYQVVIIPSLSRLTLNLVNFLNDQEAFSNLLLVTALYW